MRVFGIIGWPLGFSFSKNYFDEKFAASGLPDKYYLFPLEDISGLARVLAEYPDLAGFNVTIPYKKEVMPWLDEVSEEARAIGAVNCVGVSRNAAGSMRLAGHNTDAHGFRVGLDQLTGGDTAGMKALVLGTGGASYAVQWVLKSIGMEYRLVSRAGGRNVDGGSGDDNGVMLSYEELTPDMVEDHRLIVNTTPLGMFPNVEGKPSLPYDAIGKSHCLYDLVYNPAETAFLKEGVRRGARVKGGETMLYAQAEKNWEIWSESRAWQV
jgi:shikimate dehydrogenase